MLNENLGSILKESIEAEGRKLSSGVGSGGNEKMKRKEREKVLTAFRQAFSEELLGRIETGVRGVLKGVAERVEECVEEKLVKPCVEVGGVCEKSTKEVEELRRKIVEGEVSVGKGKEEESEEEKRRREEEEMMGKVEGLLEKGDVRKGLDVATGGCGKVLEFALDKVLNMKEVDSEMVLSEPKPMKKEELVAIIALLGKNMEDRSTTRLLWITEAVMGLEDAAEGEENSSMVQEKLKQAIQDIAKTQNSKKFTLQDTKQCKILLRILKAQTS